jgi:DNA helicase-2/ATP-dependent DNA helicase PcrA
VNPLQKLLLDLWAGSRDDICVVGDPRQTIYSFAGASSSYLTGFAAEYPDCTVIKLIRNYRSTPQVVALANRLSGAAALAGPTLVAQRPPGPDPEFTQYADEQEEASAVAERAAALIEGGTAAAQIAVLVRTNAQTRGYEEALTGLGVAFQLRGAERFFDRAEVKQAVALLRAAARSAGDEDPAAAARAVLSGLGLTGRAPAGRGMARDRWESLAALAQLADDFFAAAPHATVTDLAADLALRSQTGQAPATTGVTLASLHAAKGLEWDAVFLPGLTDGTVPIVYAQTSEAIEEERRLLYVGVTRARERVMLSWALARSPGGRAARQPSRFLDGIRPARLRARAGRAGTVRR